MRKSNILFTIVLVSVCGFSCKNHKPTVYNIAECGTAVSNPVNSQLCIQDRAKESLESLRYIDGLVYKMDYLSPALIDDFVDADIRRWGRRDSLINERYFYPEGWEDKPDNPQACSGFVCRNEIEELLFCRNFDGSDGDCLVLVDTVNGYKKVMLTASFYNSVLYKSDNALSNGKSSLHRLMRQPFVAMDGMNEYGLCFGAFQLPNLADAWPDSEKASNNPDKLDQNTGKKALHPALFHNVLLSRCKTVKEVEQLLAQYDMVNFIPVLNIHWLVADASGDWAIIEYWKNKLHVYREKDLQGDGMIDSDVPYEWMSIENYYRNPELVATYHSDGWQKRYSPKVRVTHMMKAYKPVMTLEEALACSQEGIFSLEEASVDKLTNWSCIYNPKELTVHFYNRNDTSKLYVINLKQILKIN